MLNSSELVRSIIEGKDPEKIKANFVKIKREIYVLIDSDDDYKHLTSFEARTNPKLAQERQDLMQTALSSVLNSLNYINNEMALLHHTSYYDKKEISKILLENGANPNVLDQNGDTPAHHVINSIKAAIKHEIGAGMLEKYRENIAKDYLKLYSPILGLLVSYGADLNLPNDQGITASEDLREVINKFTKDSSHIKLDDGSFKAAYKDSLIEPKQNYSTKNFQQKAEKENKGCCIMM
ncbi:hypothetical protein I862_05315 [endosymbiont of Acanthamoeba sp. UWC8]|uniref:ankyrin repeat domain-containing protein n=1 Tax=endosymbiont of Acanthamoeba sp. UWC8 TaxID=86106 RepID=UPI0004D0FDE1|nr:ankyrin repeat domain-containing protein [endosymbiont of Acanthamoeba sp. UWC8]AIF81617.1 hypothetical protein I862_05315 [endosymbiont of Acanthamoeba sp. UWC8]